MDFHLGKRKTSDLSLDVNMTSCKEMHVISFKTFVLKINISKLYWVMTSVFIIIILKHF